LLLKDQNRRLGLGHHPVEISVPDASSAAVNLKKQPTSGMNSAFTPAIRVAAVNRKSFMARWVACGANKTTFTEGILIERLVLEGEVRSTWRELSEALYRRCRNHNSHSEVILGVSVKLMTISDCS
jgi:hypothetical protein